MLSAFADPIEHHNRVVHGVAGNGKQCHGKEAVDFQLKEQAELSKDAADNDNVMGQGDQSQKGISPVVSEGDIDSNPRKRHEQ